jgi:hypothetical protein
MRSSMRTSTETRGARMRATIEVKKSSVKRQQRTPAVPKQSSRRDEFALGLAADCPAVMPMASDVDGTTPGFPRDAIPALRLHFQSSRADYLERRQSPENPGFIELYCKLCLHLVVASRDEFVLPIAVKAHNCGARMAAI